MIEIVGPAHSSRDLRWEAAIVWVQGGPDDYPYLRENISIAPNQAFPLVI
jgi:hypothetical protein